LVIILPIKQNNNAVVYYITRGVIMIKIHLSDLLGKYRITQAELARKTGIRPATICDIYNEMCDRINLEHLDRICEVLGCDVADILEYQPNKIKKTGTNLILEQNGNRKKNN
jgi:putative transcriptional regulator